MSKLNKLTADQIRHLRRDWNDLGGSKAVDRGTLAPFHKYLESVTTFSDGTAIVLDAAGMIVLPRFDGEDWDPVNSLIKNEKEFAEAA